MMDLKLSIFQTDRVRQAVSVQARAWLSAFKPVAALGVCVAVIYGLVACVGDERPVATVAAEIYASAAWFGGTWAIILLVFLARGVVLGTAPDPVSGARNARTMTFAGVAIVTILVLGMATVASADTVDGQKPASAASDAYCGRSLGAWFYCTRPEPPPEPEKAQAAPAQSDEDRQIAEFERFKVELDRAQKLAVWVPTPENIERFYKLQRAALNQSSLFSDEYRRLIWVRPDLDYTLKRPVSELGKRQWADQRSNDREMFLRQIAGDVGLFYVYRATCGACKVFSPVMRDFAQRYTLTVKGISTDGSDNPYIGDKMVDRGQLHAWGFDNPTTPSVLLYQNSSVDPRTGEVRPQYVRLSDNRTVKVNPCLKPQGCLSYLGAGVMAQDDIVERIYVLLATQPGQDY